jgi:hypothetical protein
MGINVEINYQHSKKEKLNLMIYQLNLKLANFWTNLWPHMQHGVEGKLQKVCRFRYQTVDNKLRRLTQQQTTTPPSPEHTLHRRVVNMTDISFSKLKLSYYRKAPNTTYTANSRIGFKT